MVVVFGDSIEWAPSLDEALAMVFGGDGAETTPSDEGPADDETPGDSVPPSIQELLDQAATLLEQADEALRAGDLGGYQDLVDQARDLIEKARQSGTEAAAGRFAGAVLPG